MSLSLLLLTSGSNHGMYIHSVTPPLLISEPSISAIFVSFLFCFVGYFSDDLISEKFFLFYLVEPGNITSFCLIVIDQNCLVKNIGCSTLCLKL